MSPDAALTSAEALAVSLWNDSEKAAAAAVKGDPEPRGLSDSGLNIYWMVRNALDAREARGRQHGLLSGAMMLYERLLGFHSRYAEHMKERDHADAGKYLIGVAALDNALQDVDRLASSAPPPDAKETP